MADVEAFASQIEALDFFGTVKTRCWQVCHDNMQPYEQKKTTECLPHCINRYFSFIQKRKEAWQKEFQENMEKQQQYEAQFQAQVPGGMPGR